MILRWFIRLLLCAAVLYLGLLSVAVSSPDSDAASRAILKMALGLFVLWVGVGGSLMLTCRERFRQRTLAIASSWQVKFVLCATILALIEELIATAMTNLAPLFGVKMGDAYITASPNFFEVVLFHSVIVFIPMFAAWAWLLGRYTFSANAVFILFGITGTLSEWIAFGAGTLMSIAFWVFIYGLMVYLPAYSLPNNRTTKTPNVLHVFLAVVLPIVCSVPVALVVLLINQARQTV